MSRPKRGNYATGEAGLARYKEALRKYLAKTKKTTKPEVKKPEAKKPVAKKPVAKKPATKKPAAKKPVAKKPPVKKPVAKKPVAKKPVAKKPAGKVPAKKPLISNKQKLQIKKAATTAKTTATKTAKTVAKKAGEAKKTVTKKASQLRQALKKGKAPTPKTPQQKAVSKAYKGAKSYGKKVLKKGGKDLLKIGKGILKNPKSAAKGVLGGIATAAAGKIINRRVDSLFAKRKGMSVDEYRAARSKALKAKKPKTKSKDFSTKKNIKKQKKANTTPSSGLKIKKTQYSSGAAKKKQNFGGATGTKKADKRFGTFREGSAENRKLQLERQSGNKETYSRKVSKKAQETKTTKASSKKMHAIEKKNRERFGDAHVDRLKAKHAEWKKRRKKK